MRNRKIAVTGGAGFIGSHTVVELVAAGYEPFIIDNFSNSERAVLDGLGELCNTAISVYDIDVNDTEGLKAIFEEEAPVGVIHFAAFKAVGQSVKYPLSYFKNNIAGMISLLEAMEAQQIKHLVFSSSCTVYGQPEHLPVTEDTPTQEANSPYGYTKQVCEQMIRDANKASSTLGAVLLRYFNPIGAHPSGIIGELPLGVPDNLVPFITQTGAGLRDSLTVFGNDYKTADGSCVRDYIHVVDLAKAHIKAFEWLEKNNGQCEAYNVGTGRGNTVLEVINSFEKVSGNKLNYKIGARRDGDVEQIWASPDKAARELGWKAEKSLEDALRDAWKWQEHLKTYQ